MEAVGDDAAHALWPLNPIFPLQQNPDPWRLPPDPLTDRSRWTLPDFEFVRPHMTSDEFRQLLKDSVVEMPAKTWHPEPTHLEVAPYDAELEQIKALRDANWNPYRPMGAGDALEAGQGPDGTLID